MDLLEDVEIELRQARNNHIYSDILTGTMMLTLQLFQIT
jgi:hypothetical protein